MQFKEWLDRQYLYHATRGEFKDQIIQKGLLAKSGNKTWDNLEDGVFLTEKPYRAFEWVRLAYRQNRALQWDRAVIVLFQVDVSCLDPKKMRPDHIGTSGDWRYLGDIPSECVRFIREVDETDQTPHR